MALKQLKKTVLLTVLSLSTAEAPMSRGDIVEALEEYEFIDSYLTYLLEDQIKAGKILKDEDGNFYKKPTGRTSAGPRTAYRVDMESHDFQTMEVGPNDPLDKDAGWASTPAAAVKRAKSLVFQEYKGKTAQLDALLEEVNSDVGESEAA